MTLLVTLGFSCGCASPSARLPDGASALDAMFDDAAPPTDASPSTDGHFPLDASIDAGEGAYVRACDPHGRCELEAGAALCRCDAGWTGARCDEHAREAYDRVLVSIDLADPAALVLDDGRVLFSGTRGGRTLPLIERFRVYYTSDGAFRDFAESEYDGHSDDVFIELLGGAARRSRFDGTSCRRAPSTRSTCGERTEPGSRRVRAPRSYEGHWATTTPDTAGPRQPMCPSRRSPR